MAFLLALVGVALVGIWWVGRVVHVALDLGLLAYVGLVLACWVGAGGALVPVPGVRPMSWLMVVHQGAVLLAPVVAVVAALAMAVGQTSYFLATQTGRRRYERAGSGQAPAAAAGEARSAAPPSGTASDLPIGRTASGSSAGGRHAVVVRSEAVLSRWRAAVARRMRGTPRRILFLLSTLPSPLTTFATITAASQGVPFAQFFVSILAGYLVFTTLLVIAGQGILIALGISG